MCETLLWLQIQGAPTRRRTHTISPTSANIPVVYESERRAPSPVSPPNQLRTASAIRELPCAARPFRGPVPAKVAGDIQRDSCGVAVRRLWLTPSATWLEPKSRRRWQDPTLPARPSVQALGWGCLGGMGCRSWSSLVGPKLDQPEFRQQTCAQGSTLGDILPETTLAAKPIWQVTTRPDPGIAKADFVAKAGAGSTSYRPPSKSEP